MTTMPPDDPSAMYTWTCGSPGIGVEHVSRKMPAKGIAKYGRLLVEGLLHDERHFEPDAILVDPSVPNRSGHLVDLELADVRDRQRRTRHRLLDRGFDRFTGRPGQVERLRHSHAEAP